MCPMDDPLPKSKAASKSKGGVGRCMAGNQCGTLTVIQSPSWSAPAGPGRRPGRRARRALAGRLVDPGPIPDGAQPRKTDLKLGKCLWVRLPGGRVCGRSQKGPRPDLGGEGGACKSEAGRPAPGFGAW